MINPSVGYSAPGYYYALAYSLAAVVYIFQNPPRRRGVFRYVLPFAFAAGITFFSMGLDRQVSALFVPTLLAVVCLVDLMLWCCCRIPYRNALYFTMRAFVLGELMASVQWQLYIYWVEKRTQTAGISPSDILFSREMRPLRLLMLVLVYGASFAVTTLLERRFRHLNANLRVSWTMLLQTFLITLGVYLFSNISNVLQDTPFSSSLPREILLIRALVDLGGVLMLYNYHFQLQDLDARVEIQTLQRLMDTQYANYQVNEQSMALVQQKYHDLKHQIAYLRTELPQEEKQARLDEMEQEIRSFEAHCNTGNEVLDTILSSKVLQCQSEDITMTCVVDGKCVSFMDEMDLIALFGNALDNAIEGVRKVSTPQDRMIHVEVSHRKNFAVIAIGNSCAGSVQFEHGIPATSKRDKRLHGFGTRSIASIAEKYQGTATFEARDGWFELKVILPVQ